MRGLALETALGVLLALTATASAQPPVTRVPDQPAWYESALKFVPPGMIAGYAVRSDEAKLKGIVPVFPATADDPAKFASTFDRGQVLEVELKRNGGTLEAAAATLRPREPSENRCAAGHLRCGPDAAVHRDQSRGRRQIQGSSARHNGVQLRRLVRRPGSQGPERARRALGAIARCRHAAAALPVQVQELERPSGRLAHRIRGHRLQGRLVSHSGGEAAGTGIRRRAHLSEEPSPPLCRARLGRRQQDRRVFRQRRDADRAGCFRLRTPTRDGGA